MTEREIYFIKELEKLTRKTGIAISGCGCCGSPSLVDIVTWKKDGEEYRYGIGTSFSELCWGRNSDGMSRQITDIEEYTGSILDS